MSISMDWMAIAKIFIPAIITGIGGMWAHWAWTREKNKEAELRDQERQAEYEAFKRKRKLVGAGEVERIQRAELLTKLAIEQEKHGLTGKKWKAAQERILGKPTRRTKAETADPPTDEVGPNGGRIQYMSNGDKVEWINEDGEEWPLILRRNDTDILTAENEFYEKVWWNRHVTLTESTKPPESEMTDTLKDIHASADRSAQEIETKYKPDELTVDQYGWGFICGKLSALRWVMGDEWDNLDT